jgi:phosphotriesterase-related protein
VLATGFWVTIPRSIVMGATPDQLAKAFIREIEVGIEGTGIKAGIIKVATDLENLVDGKLNPGNELVLRAAARASKHTGVPISTHTAARARLGDLQLEIFEEEGIDPRTLYIGHSNDTDDMDYLLGLLRKGCILGMDRYPGGRTGGLNWENRTQVVKQLIDQGFAGQLALSHDFGGWRPATVEQIEMRKAYNPDGYCFIIRKVLPRLRELGVREEDIRTMTVDVPRRFIGGK